MQFAKGPNSKEKMLQKEGKKNKGESIEKKKTSK